jgi:hypothetical protein
VDAHFQEPGWFTKNVFNRLITALETTEGTRLSSTSAITAR